MLAAILLALIGAADIVRVVAPGRLSARRGALIAASWIVLAVLAIGGLGMPWWAVLLEAAAAGGWLATTTTRKGATTPARSAPAFTLALVVAVLALAGGSVVPSGFLVDAAAGSALPALHAVPLAAIAAGVGAALFLVESANVVVTSVLPTMPQPDSSRRPLQGGRVIGPIERLLLAGFTLAGAWPVVAALVAAKGIVRFPEISKATDGNPAEYFLIGSLVSWACAFSLAGLCWVLAAV